MRFIFSRTLAHLKLPCTSGVLLIILVWLSVSSVSSFPSKGGHECPDCGKQYIKITDALTGKCAECWGCPECNEGLGSSVLCPSTVTVGTAIKCVPCIKGKSFSDSHDTSQCRPCGVCSGKHEHVLHECTLESDVKCDCDAGFYRNKTTNECLPCGSCSDCYNDDEISSKCQEDDEHQSKPSSPTCSTMVVSAVGSTVVKSCTTVLATSSSLLSVSSTYFHVTATPKLPLSVTMSMSPVPSRTQQIQPTSAANALKSSKYDITPTQSAAKVINYHNRHKTGHTVLSVVCAFIFICFLARKQIFGFLYHKFKKVRSRRLIDNQRKVQFSVLQQNDQGNHVSGEESSSRRSSDVDAQEGSSGVPDLSSSVNTSGNLNKMENSVLDGRVTTAAREAAVQKGIPLSLEGETRKPMAKGGQANFTSTITSVNGKMVPSSDPGSPNVSPQNKTPSAANTVNVILNFNPGNTEQISAPSQSSQMQRAAFSPFAESTSHGNNVLIPASVSGMTAANQGAANSGLSSVLTPAVQPPQGNRGYATHITNVPLPVIHKICMMLDLKRDVEANDYRMFGYELGLDSLQISILTQKFDSPSNVLLMQVFPALPDSGTVGHLVTLLRKMGRHDVIHVIDEWIASTQVTQVN